VGVDTCGDLALLRGRELRAEAAARRLAREARAVSRSCCGGGWLRITVGTALMRAGLRLEGKPPVSGSRAVMPRPYCR
jgi:hypothetical protein